MAASRVTRWRRHRDRDRSGQRELLGRQHVVRLGDPGWVLWQPHRAVVKPGIRSGQRELLGCQDVVRRFRFPH